jgi:hypothetical protein
MLLVLNLLSLYLLPSATATLNGTWGVNIHFTQQQPGELDMLRRGFGVTRMDFTWASIETELGVYDFSGKSRLICCCSCS